MPDVIVLSAAVAVLSTLVSISKAFESFRLLVPGLLQYLFSCPICLSFWIAAPLCYQHYGFAAYSYLLVVAASNVWMLAIVKLYVELDLLGD